jgi:RNA polymerase sigma-70 factor
MRLPYGLLWFSLLFLVFHYICTSKLSYKIEKLNGKMVNELLFEQLFRMYYAELCRYASRYLSDKQIVEDIVQSFFIAVWEKDGLTINGDNFLPYVYRSVYNRCLNYYKAELSKESFLASLVEEWNGQAEEENDFRYKQEVREALRKLPPKCKQVFLLKCIKGLKYKEIAEVSGISVNTVKYHLGEAFRIMREELIDLQGTVLLFMLMKPVFDVVV